MNLEQLRASLEQYPPEFEAAIEDALEKAEREDEKEKPFGVAQVVTPSGLEIYYQAGPKRLYKIRAAALRPEEEGGYPTDWREVPSVSTILEVLEKGGLSWWGMKVGVQGVWALRDIYANDEDFVLCADAEQIVDLLKEHKLTVNHVKGQAADRGTNVHSALEAWVETGITPRPELFPENERGYVEGLVAFINDANPHPLHSELMVASADGWAGRFDLVANLDLAGKVVVKTYPKKQPVREAVSGAWILDLKTSKDVYPSYKLQVGGAYRHGFEECGYGEVDHAGVVRVTDDGRYELVEADVAYEDFLSVLETYHIVKRLS